MSEHVTVLESAASSSASSIAVKTTVVGGAGVGATSVIPGMDTNHVIVINYVDDALKPFLQSNHIFVFNYAEICQLIATAWIIWQAFNLVKAKISSLKQKKKDIDRPSIMGGNGGSGPGEEEVEKED